MLLTLQCRIRKLRVETMNNKTLPNTASIQALISGGKADPVKNVERKCGPYEASTLDEENP